MDDNFSKIQTQTEAQMQTRRSFWKGMAISAGGFGLGGLVWGWEAYRGTVGSEETFTNPFSYILGAVALAVLGGLALAYLSHTSTGSAQERNGSFPSPSEALREGGSMSRLVMAKNTWKIVGFGLIGWLVAFVVVGVSGEWFFLTGSVFLPFLLGIFTIPLGFIGLDNALNISLDPSFFVGSFWLGFLFVGIIIGLIYSLMIIRTRIIRAVLYGASGLALASLIGPILGNLVGNLFDSLHLSYLLTFLIIGIIFGISLFLGSNKEKEGSGPA